MSPDKAQWSLLHIESKSQIDSLSFQQAALLVGAFNPAELINWAAWHEGLSEWQSLEDLASVLNPPRARATPKTNKPPTFMGVTNTGSGFVLSPDTAQDHAPNLSQAHAPEHAETVAGATPLRAAQAARPAQAAQPSQAMPSGRTEDGRLSKRFTRKYKAFVNSKGKMHESITVDLSLTGLQLQHGLPQGEDGPFEVTLVNTKGESLQLICSVIPDKTRNRLKIARAAKLDQLRKWLLDATA